MKASRIGATVAVALASTTTAAPVASGGLPPSGISGVVRNTTCPGPCRHPAPPAPLYTGAGLTVRVRNLSTHELVGVEHPIDGRFHFDVGPGLFRVRARVDGECWQGSSRKAGIVDSGVRVRLTVRNGCVV